MFQVFSRSKALLMSASWRCSTVSDPSTGAHQSKPRCSPCEVRVAGPVNGLRMSCMAPILEFFHRAASDRLRAQPVACKVARAIPVSLRITHPLITVTRDRGSHAGLLLLRRTVHPGDQKRRYQAGTVDGSPQPLSNWFGSTTFEPINAALYSGPYCYFFAGKEYIRATRDGTDLGSLDSGYPAPISRWNWPAGFATGGIQAALYTPGTITQYLTTIVTVSGSETDNRRRRSAQFPGPSLPRHGHRQ